MEKIFKLYPHPPWPSWMRRRPAQSRSYEHHGCFRVDTIGVTVIVFNIKNLPKFLRGLNEESMSYEGFNIRLMIPKKDRETF